MIIIFLILPSVTILVKCSAAVSFDDPSYFGVWKDAGNGVIPFRSLWGILSFYKEIQYVSINIMSII